MRKIFLIAMFLTVALGFSSTNAFADGARVKHVRKSAGKQVIVVNSKNHHNHAGRFSRPALFWPAPKNCLAIGVFVARLPYGYKTIIVRGAAYHRYNNTYYKACRSGYLVVRAPC